MPLDKPLLEQLLTTRSYLRARAVTSGALLDTGRQGMLG